MLIHVRYGASSTFVIQENCPRALDTLMARVHRCSTAPSRIWWALPTDPRQADTLSKLLVKSAAFLPEVSTARGAGHRAFREYGGSIPGHFLMLTGGDNFQHSVALFENLLRKLVNILTWVEYYGQDSVLTERPFKRETFEKVAHRCEPLIEGRAANVLRFPVRMETPSPAVVAVPPPPPPVEETEAEVSSSEVLDRTLVRLRRRSNRPGTEAAEAELTASLNGATERWNALIAEEDTAEAARLTDEPPTTPLRVVAAALGLPSELMAEDGSGEGERDAAPDDATDSLRAALFTLDQLREEHGDTVEVIERPAPNSEAGALSIMERIRNPETGHYSVGVDMGSDNTESGIPHGITPSAEGEDE